MKVFVVQMYELGWDNVIGVFDSFNLSLEDLRELFPEDEYYIEERTLQSDLEYYK